MTILSELGNRTSPYTGKFRHRWPIHVDPDNIAHVFIRHPDTGEWHTLEWEHAAHVDAPFSEEALQYARRIVLREHGFVDDRLALDELLTRWNLHMGVSAAERRMALRMSRQDEALSNQIETTDAAVVAGLPAVQAVTGPADRPPLPQTRRPPATTIPTTNWPPTTTTTPWTGHDDRPARRPHGSQGGVGQDRQCHRLAFNPNASPPESIRL